MKVPSQKLETAYRARLAGASLRHAARLSGLSRNTVRKHERGWTGSRGVHHRGWEDRLRAAQRKGKADRQQNAEQQHERTRQELRRRIARRAFAKIQKMFPALMGDSPAGLKALLAELRELRLQLSLKPSDLEDAIGALLACNELVAEDGLVESSQNTVQADRAEDSSRLDAVPSGDGPDTK